jgi:hypothetical protein
MNELELGRDQNRPRQVSAIGDSQTCSRPAQFIINSKLGWYTCEQIPHGPLTAPASSSKPNSSTRLLLSPTLSAASTPDARATILSNLPMAFSALRPGRSSKTFTCPCWPTKMRLRSMGQRVPYAPTPCSGRNSAASLPSPTATAVLPARACDRCNSTFQPPGPEVFTGLATDHRSLATAFMNAP